MDFLKDVPNATLGTLDPVESCPGYVLLHGIQVPKRVADAIREAGISIHQLNRGDLEEAILAMVADSVLFEDPDDATFRGKIHLTAGEVQSRQSRITPHVDCQAFNAWAEKITPREHSFCSRLNAEDTPCSPNGHYRNN